MAYEFVLTERLDGVAVITLNRPEKLNALSFGLARRALDEALSEYEGQETAIKAVILTRAGERAFSRRRRHPRDGRPHQRGIGPAPGVSQRGHLACREFSKPLIGAINGLAYGGAALLSSTLDLRIGCECTRVPFSGRELWTGQFDLVIAVAGRPAESQGAVVHRARRRRRRGAAHRAVEPGRAGGEADRNRGRDRADDREKRCAMVQGIKRLLHEQIGAGWRDRYASEEDARASWLEAGHPRDGFKDFLSRKGPA